MRIIHAKRPTSQIVERSPEMTPIKSRRRIIADVMDDDFLRGPIDLRKLTPTNLPKTPVGNESDLTIPLSSIIGTRVATAQRPDSKEAGRSDIDDLKAMLVKMKTPKKRKKEYHLSDHLKPPVKYRYCPEQAYTDKKIQIVRDRDMVATDSKPKSRGFPFELFTYSMGGATGHIVRPTKPASAETFTEPAYEIHDFFK